MSLNNTPVNGLHQVATLHEQEGNSNSQTTANTNIYEQIMCYFFEKIQQSLATQEDLTILSYQIYFKQTFDKILNAGYFTSNMLTQGLDLIIANFSKILFETTQLQLLDSLDDDQVFIQDNVSDHLDDFLESKQRLLNFFNVMSAFISPQKLNASTAIIALALTKTQFYNFSQEEMLKGCFGWLSKIYDIEIPVMDEYGDEVHDCSSIFADLIEQYDLA